MSLLNLVTHCASRPHLYRLRPLGLRLRSRCLSLSLSLSRSRSRSRYKSLSRFRALSDLLELSHRDFFRSSLSAPDPLRPLVPECDGCRCPADEVDAAADDEDAKSMLLRFPRSCSFCRSSASAFCRSAMLSAQASLPSPCEERQTSGGKFESFSSTSTKSTSFERMAGLRKDLLDWRVALKWMPCERRTWKCRSLAWTPPSEQRINTETVPAPECETTSAPLALHLARWTGPGPGCHTRPEPTALQA